MPELPEVETMRRGILPIVGQYIADISKPISRYRPIQIFPEWRLFRKRTVGRAIVGVDRIAKRVAIRLDSGDSLLMQPRMAGLVLLGESPSEQHVRLIVSFRNEQAGVLQYWDRRGLGSIALWNPEEMERFLGPSVLGPDALTVELKEFIQKLSGNQREIKVAMLDQHLVAGIGNLYAAEILHAAKIHPQARCNLLNLRQWKRIHATTQSILHQAIEMEGSTLGDGTYRNALNDPGSYQNHHRVYARADQLCLTCAKSQIVRIVQSQRSTFYCPHCQKLAAK